MKELRPHIPETAFVPMVRSQQNQGYALACLSKDEAPVAVAGFRLIQNLAWGRFMYIDDLVCLSGHRSLGYGARLLSWLKDYATRKGCEQIHLDSGMQRKDAHRFYTREGMEATGLHFCLAPPPEIRTVFESIRELRATA